MEKKILIMRSRPENRALFFVLFLCFLSGACFAETVYFTNGKKIDGVIENITVKGGLVIDVGGVSLKYGLEEIKRVDVLPDGVGRQDILDYIEAVNLMIADDLRDEAQKEDEINRLRMDGKPWHGYLVSEEAGGLVGRHRRQIDLIKTPVLCERLKEMYIKWMLSRENKHYALFHQDWGQAQQLQKQITEYVDKINHELKRLHWLLVNEEILLARDQPSGRQENVLPPENQPSDIQE